MKPKFHFKSLVFAACLILAACAPENIELSDSELGRVGRRVWQNECAGTRDGLTSWNSGEAFASLGIGHFIWYPKGMRGPFDESFPKLVREFESSGVKVPAWIKGPCPWKTRGEFQKDFRGERLNELRELLTDTFRIQAKFLAKRMEDALPKMLDAAPRDARKTVQENFHRLSQSSEGTFALIDYVNFKGEGIKAEERYNGEGWGLLQVLSTMKTGGNPVSAFSDAAAEVLTRRVKNAPPARNEAKWLPGWKNRVNAY